MTRGDDLAERRGDHAEELGEFAVDDRLDRRQGRAGRLAATDEAVVGSKLDDVPSRLAAMKSASLRAATMPATW